MNAASARNFASSLKPSATAAIALALCLISSPAGLPIASAQDQSSAPQVADQQAANQVSNQALADAQQGGPPPGAPPPEFSRQNSAPQGPPPQFAQGPAVPETLTLPAGTVIPVRVSQWLSSDRNIIGDSFSATLDQPLVVNGWVVARRGQSVIGRVAMAQKAGHGKSDSQLGLQLNQLVLIDGQQVPVETQLSQSAAGGPSQGQQVGRVGVTAAIGAAIGAVAGGGPGAAIGAGVGTGAGIAGVMSTRGRPTVIPPETLLMFTLQTPLQVSTAQSRVAFQPVSQRDYGRDQDAYAPSMRQPGQRIAAGPGYGYPPPYYYGYCSPFGWGCYPYGGPLYLGFYGGYGFGYRGRFIRR